MAEGTPHLPGSVGLVKRMPGMAFLARIVHSARIARFCLKQLGDLPGRRMRLQSRGEDSIRTCVSGEMTGAARLLVRPAMAQSQFFEGMGLRKWPRIDENLTRTWNPQQDQQRGASECDGEPIHPAADRAQCRHRRAVGRAPAATAVRERPTLAFFAR